MQLPPEAIGEFKVIYKKEFGILLSDEDAREKAESFLEFMEIVARPIDKRAAGSFKMKKGAVQ